MGKIALLVSREEMIHQAHNILQEKKFEIQEMRVIHTEDTVMEARRSIADGATIIIARGLQASIIKQYTDTPVVEIVLTAQEMALLVMRAKQIAGKEKRKTKGSKEGTLGVEGVPNQVIIQALQKAGVDCLDSRPNRPQITKADFYEWGLTGMPGSQEKRKQLLQALDLPSHMTANALLEFINAVADYDTVKQKIEQL